MARTTYAMGAKPPRHRAHCFKSRLARSAGAAVFSLCAVLALAILPASSLGEQTGAKSENADAVVSVNQTGSATGRQSSESDAATGTAATGATVADVAAEGSASGAQAVTPLDSLIKPAAASALVSSSPLASVQAQASTKASSNLGASLSVVASGTFPSDTAASWTLTSDGALTFAGTGTVTNNYTQGNTPWSPYSSQVKTATFTGSVSFTNLDYWLCGFPSLTTVTFPDGFGKDVTSMGCMFGGSSALTSVSFPAGFGTKAVLMAYLFRGCSGLKSVTMQADFGRSGTNMAYMFADCASLTSLTLPSGFGLSCGFAEGMIYGCSTMTYLDLSAVSMPLCTNMGGVFGYCSALKEVKLGANWSFKGAGTTVLTTLPDPQSPFTMWRAVGAGTVAAPKGAMYTAANLASAYTGSMADTYVWVGPLAGTLSLSGTPTVGTALTPVTSGLSSGASLSYTWYSASDTTSAGTVVGTDSTYTPTYADLGKYLYVSAVDNGVYAGSITSARSNVSTAPIYGSLAVSGTSAVVHDLTASGSGTPPGANLSYTWYVASDTSSVGTAVSTKSTYQPVVGDFGKYVYATATDSSGVYTGTVYSSRTLVIITGVFDSGAASWTIMPDGTMTFAGSGTVSDYYASWGNAPWYAYASLIKSVVFTGSAAYQHMQNWFFGCSNLTSVSVNAGTGAAAVDFCSLFWNCSSLTSVSLPSGFGTSVNNANSMFRGCTSLVSLTVPSGCWQSGTELWDMFYGCSGLSTLDLSNANTLKCTSMTGFFSGCSSLKQVKLGANWSFKGAWSTVQCQLPDPPSPYGLWRAVGAGTVAAPKGAFYTATSLASSYTSTMADTYVWAQAMGGTVSVSGSFASGSPLTASIANPSSGSTPVYTWYVAPDTSSAGTQVVTGTTTYTPTTSDVGKYIYVSVSDSSGTYGGSVSSARTRITTTLAGTVSAGSSASVGTALTAVPSGLSTGATPTYTWYVAADTTSAGTQMLAGSASYTPTSSDLGKYAYVVASDTSGVYTGTIASGRLRVTTAISGTVSVSGSFTTGSTLTASLAPMLSGASLAYAWYRASDTTSAGTQVGTAASYALTSADLGSYVYAVISDTSGIYTGSSASGRSRVTTPLTGTVSVSGSFTTGSTLTASLAPTLSGASLAYAWYSASDTTSAGTQVGTAASYALTSADLGKYIYVSISDTSGIYTGSLAYARARVTTALTGSVSLSGSPVVGTALTATAPTPSGGSLSYAWYSAPDATSAGTKVASVASYTPKTSDLGAYLYAVVSDTSGIYTGSISSSHVMVTTPLSGTVSVSGVFRVGSALTVTVPDISTGAKPAYAWYSASDAVSVGTLVETSNTYTPTTSDLGKYVYVKVSDTSGVYTGSLTYSRALVTTPLPGTVSIAAPVVGTSPTVTPAGTPTGANFVYSWFIASDSTSAGTKVSTQSTYAPTSSDLGKYLYVSLSDSSGVYTGSISSTHLRVTTPMTGTMSVSGSFTQGSTVMMSPGTMPPGASAAYAWYSAPDTTSTGTVVATTTSYTLQSSDLGKYVYAAATDTSGMYTGMVASSRSRVTTSLTGSVSVSGTFGVGYTLTASGPSTQTGATYAFTWYSAPDTTSAGTQVATGSTYKPVSGDFGKYLYVTAVDTSGIYTGTISTPSRSMVLITGTFPSCSTASWTITPDGMITFAGTGAVTDRYSTGTTTPWYSYRTQITSATFTGDATYAYLDCWFYNSMNITTVFLPSGLGRTTVGMSSMFRSCSKLASLSIPDSFGLAVTDVSYMFTSCGKLSSLSLPSSFAQNATNYSYLFSGCSSLPSLNLPAGFGQNATSFLHTFHGCSSLTALILPSGFGSNVTEFSYMFYGCSSLPSLTLPAGFGQNMASAYEMFYNCTALASLTLPLAFGQSATNAAEMFWGCSSLPSITLPAGFGQYATKLTYFCYGCSSLSSLNLPSGFGQSATSFGSICYGCSSLVSLDLSGVNSLKATSMGDAFYRCTALKQVKLGANWSFKGAGSTVLCQLPTPAAPYSQWRAVGAGNVSAPAGTAYTASSLASGYTGLLADSYVWQPYLTGGVGLTGVPAPDHVLTAAVTNAQSDAVPVYTWYVASDTTSAGTQVSTEPTYTPVAADLGKYVYATATDSSGTYTGTTTSSRLAVKAALDGTVSVTGSALVGTLMTATASNLSSGATASYAWYVAPDSTSVGTLAVADASYTPVADDYGKYIYAAVTDSSGTYSGSVVSDHVQVSAVLSITVPTTMPLATVANGTVTGAQAQAQNASLVPVHVSALTATAAAPFLLADAASFDAASGQNLLNVLLAPGGGSAIDLASYQSAAQPPAGQWNMAASGGTLSITPSGRLKNATTSISSTPVQALDLSWSFAAGNL